MQPQRSAVSRTQAQVTRNQPQEEFLLFASARRNSSYGHKKKFLRVHYFWAVLYNGPLPKNITKTYKKVAPDVTNPIDLEAKCIAKKLQFQVDDLVNATAKR